MMVFSAIILVVLWMLQFLLLNTFYINMKQNEVVQVGQKIASDYENSNFEEIIGEYAFKNNLRIVLLDERGKVTHGSDGFGSPMQPGGNAFLSPLYEKILAEFGQTENNDISFSDNAGRDDMSQIVYAAKVKGSYGETNYLCIVSPIPPIDSTTTVLSTQFIIISVILLVLAVVIAQVISRKMSKPIIQLTSSAQKLAEGDLQVRFEGESYTEIYQLASALNYATHEISKTDIYRKELMANVSHDLKTPLTIIRMYAEMLRDIAGESPEKRELYSQQIIKEADWLSEMVNEVLDQSKLESGVAKLKKTVADFSKCLKDVLSSFQVLVEREGYVIHTDISEHILVECDEQYLRRVLYNLISNAVNYTGEDKTVWVLLKESNGLAHFAVTDSGQGIPKDELGNIWDRYYKSRRAHKRAVVGTGLGLSIAKYFFEQHQAKYGVKSEEGCGSTFWFELNTKPKRPEQ